MSTNKVWDWLKATLMSGLLVVSPVAVTVWLLIKILLFLDGLLSESIKWTLIHFGVELSDEQTLYGPGLIALVVLLLLIGWLARMYIGRRIVTSANTWFEKLPVISTIYSTIQPLSRAIFGGQEKFFREVVWAPQEQRYLLGFVIGAAPDDMNNKLGKEMIAVYIPFAPPTTGMLLYYPKEDLVKANYSVEEGLKLLFSFGAVQSKTE